jgi:putative oxidoreductase
MGSLDKWQPQILAALRIFTGLLFFEHGSAKLLHFPHVAMFDGKLSTIFLVTGAMELVGGVLVTLGFFSRWAAFILSGEMAVGYFMVHAPKGFFPLLNQGEPAILYCFVFLYLAAGGPGAFHLNRR